MCPINEASYTQRDRWPLRFDLEGVPRDSAERERLLELENREEQMNTHPVKNSFASEYQAGETVVDINNPPSPYVRGRYVHQEYPKHVYPANWPAKKSAMVNSKEQEVEMLKKGFLLKPPVAKPDETPEVSAIEEEREVSELSKPKRGRPPKVQEEQAS